MTEITPQDVADLFAAAQGLTKRRPGGVKWRLWNDQADPADLRWAVWRIGELEEEVKALKEIHHD